MLRNQFVGKRLKIDCYGFVGSLRTCLLLLPLMKHGSDVELERCVDLITRLCLFKLRKQAQHEQKKTQTDFLRFISYVTNRSEQNRLLFTSMFIEWHERVFDIGEWWQRRWKSGENATYKNDLDWNIFISIFMTDFHLQVKIALFKLFMLAKLGCRFDWERWQPS